MPTKIPPPACLLEQIRYAEAVPSDPIAQMDKARGSKSTKAVLTIGYSHARNGLIYSARLSRLDSDELTSVKRPPYHWNSCTSKRIQMSIQDSTIKRLFGMSGNRCAIPDCRSPLIIGDVVVGEICHIRARRKGGARYDATLNQEQKDAFENLLLLCSTCHKLIDSSPEEYDSRWLLSVKVSHEQKAPKPLDLSLTDVRQALMILAKYTSKTQKRKNNAGDKTTFGGVQSSAAYGSVSVAIGGANQAPINIKMPARPSRTPYPANSIGADANMTNYVEYLCDLYVKYMLPIESNEDASWAKLGRHIKSKFHLKKKTRNHLSAERFLDLVNYLIREKLALTPVGRKHLRQGTKLCRTFDEFRHGEM